MAWTGPRRVLAAFAPGSLSIAVSGQASAVQASAVGPVGVVRRPSGATLGLALSFVHDPAGGPVDRIQDVAVDPWRDVIACGNRSTGDAFVIKLDGPVSVDDAPLAIAADPGGGFVVGGFASFRLEDSLVLRYALNLP